jgi:hypothetical protein
MVEKVFVGVRLGFLYEKEKKDYKLTIVPRHLRTNMDDATPTTRPCWKQRFCDVADLLLI